MSNPYCHSLRSLKVCIEDISLDTKFLDIKFICKGLQIPTCFFLLSSSPSLQSNSFRAPTSKTHLETLNARNTDMSNPPRASLTKQVARPFTQGAEKRHTNSTSLEEVVVYKCTCGTPDTTDNWICCDDEDCPIGWYHFECVRLTEAPPGDWLCPRCSLKPMHHARLLQAKMPMCSRPEKTAAKDPHDDLDHHDKEKVKVNGTRPAKKGIAVKKSTPKKKAKWVGWVETSSDDAEKHKGHEDAAQGAAIVAERRLTTARTKNSKSRMTRSQASTSNIASRLRKVMAESGRKN